MEENAHIVALEAKENTIIAKLDDVKQFAVQLSQAVSQQACSQQMNKWKRP